MPNSERNARIREKRKGTLRKQKHMCSSLTNARSQSASSCESVPMNLEARA
ncbi:MAG: hypothetical protein ACP5SE_03975 [Nitrososphaeria archaeon]